MAYTETIEDLTNPGAPIETYDYDGGTEFDRVTGLGYLADQFRSIPRPEAGSPIDRGLQGLNEFGKDTWRMGQELVKGSLGGNALRAVDWLTKAPQPKTPPAVAKPRSSGGELPQYPELDGSGSNPFDLHLAGNTIDDVSPMRYPGTAAAPPPVATAPARDESPQALRERLGFSWGKDVPLDPVTGRPQTDSTLYDPFDEKAVQAHESRGGGGFFQPEVEDIPWGQRPQSWKDELLEQIRADAAMAGLERVQNEAHDPYQVGAKTAVARATEQAKHASEVERRQSYMDDYAVVLGGYQERLAKLIARQPSMSPVEFQARKAELDQFRDQALSGLQQSAVVGARVSTAEPWKD